ncbi:MAG: Fe(3+) ABC transporter substrate-binding protein [Rhodothalassiaceae bacterium]
MKFVLIGMCLLGSTLAAAQERVVNIYSARHYDTDEALYDEFEAATGIKVNRLEGGSDQLIVRLRREGRFSPADILITVDAGRLWRAEQADLFQPVASESLTERIPANLRHPDNLWFGFSQRARLIFYRKGAIDPTQIQTYEDLADPELRGRVCIRSSGNIYNLSLMASLIAAKGEQAALEWAQGVVANFARRPQGGDIDQLRALGAGVCDVAVANSYYFARLMDSDASEDAAVVEAVGWVFPNQQGCGTHVNISGAGLTAHAPHRAEAIAFLEYLAGDRAQRYFAEGNHEYPAVPGVERTAPLDRLGPFKADPLNVAELGRYQALAQRLFDRAGWP